VARNKAATAQAVVLRITQTRSLSGHPKKHRATLEALGFRRNQQTVEHKDNPAIRGMIRQVSHMVRVEEVPEGEA
jgi:large subunit ribosomal protein L30